MIDEKKYRIEIPNIIDDLGLNPYERALYVHYKRVCGANNGQCTEGARGTAERTKISLGKVAPTRKALIARGLIAGDIHHGKDTSITVVDIWDINTAYYANKERPDIDGWTVEQIREWVANCSPPEQLNGHNSSQLEQLGNDCSPPEQNCSPPEQKKEPIKKGLSKDNGDKAPKDNSGKNPEEPRPRSQLMNEFLACSGLKMPHRSTDKKFWWSSIGELYELFDRDVDVGKKTIRQVIEEMRRDKLRITGPESLVKTARDVVAQKNHKPRITIR